MKIQMISRNFRVITILATVFTFMMTGCKSDEEAISLPGDASTIEIVENNDGTFILQTDPIENATSYIWYLNHSEYTSTSRPELEFSESGEYTVAGANGLGIGKQSDPVEVDASGRPAQVVVEQITSEAGIITLKACARNAWGYRWYLNGELLQRGSSDTYLPIEDGKYICEAYNPEGTGDSVEIDVKIGVINLLDPLVVPDENFRSMLIELGGNSEMFSNDDASKVTDLKFTGTGVADMTGIRFFYNLKNLNMQYCGSVKYLDLRYQKQLENLDLFETSSLIELNIKGLENIKTLNINSSKIGAVDISELSKSLESLNAGYGHYETLDLTGFDKLKYVNLGSDTKLKSLTAANLPSLETLFVSGSSLESLDLSGCSSLKSLVTSFSSQLTQLTLPGSAPMEELKVARSGKELIDASVFSRFKSTLKTVYADEINLSGSLELIDFPMLEDVQFDKNLLTSATIDNCPNLNRARFGENSKLKEVTLKKLPNLNVFYCYQTKVTSLDFSECPMLLQAIIFENSNMNSVDFTGCGILQWLSMEYCKVGPRLDISETTNLESVACQGTSIEQIKINSKYNCSNVPFGSNIPKGAKYVHEFE